MGFLLLTDLTGLGYGDVKGQTGRLQGQQNGLVCRASLATVPLLKEAEFTLGSRWLSRAGVCLIRWFVLEGDYISARWVRRARKER